MRLTRSCERRRRPRSPPGGAGAALYHGGGAAAAPGYAGVYLARGRAQVGAAAAYYVPVVPVGAGEARADAGAFADARVDQLSQGDGVQLRLEEAEVPLALGQGPGLEGEYIPAQAADLGVHFRRLAQYALHGLGGLQALRGEGRGDRCVGRVQRGVVGVGRRAADQAQPGAAAVAHGVHRLYEPDFPRARAVRRAAGAQIHAWYLHYAHLAVQLLLAAVVQGGERIPVRQEAVHGDIAPDGAVGLELAARYVRRGELHGEVQRHIAPAHVEAHVLAVIEAVDRAGEDVLAGVRLHTREPQRPVHRPSNGFSNAERGGEYVHDSLVLLAHTYDLQAAHGPGVGVLPAASGEERGPVEHDGPGPALGLAGDDPGLEGAQLPV